jgi:small subunit ribosomal protein S17
MAKLASLRISSFTGERLAAPRAAPAAASRPAALSVQAVQTLVGEVVSNKCTKSVVIRVDRQVPHPKYMKRVTLSKKYMAHDEDESCKVGDLVQIIACRPLSARKRFKVTGIVKAAFVMGENDILPTQTA